MIVIELPFPPAELSPNYRGHWAPISRQKKSYRLTAGHLTRSAMAKADSFSQLLPVRLNYEFHPPQARSYDRDNLIARLKAGIDGISDALNINDSVFHIGTVEIKEKVKGGLVRVTIEQVEP